MGKHWLKDLVRVYGPPNYTGSRGVFLAAIGADKTEIEASFCQAIRIAKQQKSVSLKARAEASYSEYRHRKSGFE
jgi:hypothetical protein